MSQGNAGENCAKGIYQIPRSLTKSDNGALWDIYQQPRRSEPGNISCSFTAGASVLTNESIYQVPRSLTNSFMTDHDIYQRPRQIASIGDGDSTCNADDEIYRIPNSLPATGPPEQTESLYQVPSSRPVSAGAGDAIYQVPRHTSFSESAAGTVQDPIEMSKTIDLQHVGDAGKSVTTELTDVEQGITVRPAVAPKAKPAVKARVKPTVKEKAKPALAPKVKPAVKARVKPTVKEKVKPAVAPKAKPAVKTRAKSVAAEKAMPAVEAKLKPTVAPKPKKSGSVSHSRNTSVAASETILGDNVEQLAIGENKKNSIAQKQDTDNQ